MTEPTTDNTDDTAELEEVLNDAEATGETVSRLHRHMIDFLRKKIASFRAAEPETVATLQSSIAKDEVADLYESLTDELDDSDEWDEQDVLEGAALYLLMALGMDEESPDDKNEDDDGDDDGDGK